MTTNGMMPTYICRVVICGGATPRRKNSVGPSGGCIYEVCKFTAIMMPSQTGSTPGIASSVGATIGTTTKMISNASITKQSRNMAAITANTEPTGQPGRLEKAQSSM